MSKINAWNLKRPAKKLTRVTVTDDSNPDISFDLVLKEPSFNLLVRLQNLVEHFTTLYLVPNAKGETASPPVIDGEPLEIITETLQLACGINILQETDEEPYTVEEILIFIETMPRGMMKVIGKTKEIIEKFESMMENPTGAAIMPQSNSIPEEQVDTPS